MAKPETAKLAGTDNGVIATMKSLGYEKSFTRPLYLTDPEKWAEFYVFITEDDIDNIKNFDIVKKEVDTVKQVSSLSNYGFALGIKTNEVVEAVLINKATINFWGNRTFYLNGTWLLDGSQNLSGIEGDTDLHSVRIKNKIFVLNQESFDSCNVKIKKNFWTLDGSCNLDGSKLLNAELIEEEL